MRTPPTPPELPPELAPSKRAEVEALLAEVEIADRPHPPQPWKAGPRGICEECKQPGKLGIHRRPDGSTIMVHRSCNRRIHRRREHGQGRSTA